MLLKKLANGFRRQDWFTVCIELLVLVVGIFLGLQVDDWNQRRLDRIEEQYYLERLGRDFERSLAEQTEIVKRARANFEDALALLLVLEARDLGSMTSAEFQALLSRLQGFPPFALVTATIDELIANGKASLLQSDELREEIAMFVDWYTDRERYYDNVARMIIDADMRQYRYLKPEWAESSDLRIPGFSAEFETLRDDPDALPVMRQLTRAKWILWRDLQQLHTETLRMNELLLSVDAESSRPVPVDAVDGTGQR